MGITHVIRGEDHVTNTGPQIQIFAALAGPTAIPTFGHHNLLTSVRRQCRASVQCFLRAGRRHLLPPEPWDGATFGRWASALKQETKRQGRALFHPLRLALTGRENGPELARYCPYRPC
jgi:glutamyl/glutaminyl-tRNA synthetase